jgi:hypothetical protein
MLNSKPRSGFFATAAKNFPVLSRLAVKSSPLPDQFMTMPLHRKSTNGKRTILAFPDQAMI